METEAELRHKFFSWSDTPLEPLVANAINSANGVAHSSYDMNGRTAALIIAVHPKVEPWRSRVQHYFDETQGNPIESIKGASYSLVLDNAFEVATKGLTSVFVIYNPPVVIMASLIDDQIKALQRDFL